MPEQEQDEFIGKTLLGYLGKKRKLCFLKVEAENMVAKLEEVASILKDVPDADGHLKHNLTSVDLPTEEAVLDMAHRIDALRAEIKRDRKDLVGMGVQFPIS